MRLPPTTYHLPPTRPDASRRGFTLIEILVVVSITVMLAAYGFSYSSMSRRQTTLFIKRAQAGQLILKAKSLTLSTRLRESVAGRPCGYGVRVVYGNPSSLTLFSYSLKDGALPPQGMEVCKKSDGTLRTGDFTQEDISSGGEKEVIFDSEVRLRADAGKLERVFFLAPDPQTFIWVDGGGGSGKPNILSGKLTLETADGKATTTVKVTAMGGVDF